MQLVILRGHPAQTFLLASGEGIIGRTPGSTIELKDPQVSRQHCRFSWDGQTLTIEDLGSSRGTYINGARIVSATVVKQGDEIMIGEVVLQSQPVSSGAPVSVPPPITTPAPPPLPAKAERAATMMVRGVPSDRIVINGELTMGRDAACEVVLPDNSISRKHARLNPLPGGGCTVTDLQSAGGSFINGRRFDEHEFTIGDRLQIGPFYFQFDGLALVRVANSAGGSIRATGLYMRVTERTLVERLQGKLRVNTILENVSVIVQASRFYGLIGPSGAGKSSLLNTLAGLRKPEGGSVIVDGEDVYAGDEPPAFGFVPQDDIVHLELTVRQALRFAARLRLAAALPTRELDRLLTQTLDQLGLTQRAELPIWRLSGGQRKRVSVAVELLAKPSILFLDEPTSGLDPATEFKLMSLLRDLADTGCTIVCTTHVMENAFLIDELVILVAGCLAFQGPASDVRDYFHVAKLTDLYDELAERPAKEWQATYQQRLSEATMVDPPAPAPVKSVPASRPRRALALPILLARQWTIYVADWRNFLLLFGQPLVIAALVAWVTDTRELMVFFAYLSTLYFGCSNASQEIVKEIAIYRRERLVGVGAHSYLASKFIFLTALTGAQAITIYTAMLLFKGGLDGWLLMQFMALGGTALAAVGIGCAISALAPSVMQAVTFVPVVLIPMIIFSGQVVKPTAMSKAVRAVGTCTPGYAAQAIMDMSFIYNRAIIEVNEDHYDAIRNLGANDADNRDANDRFTNLHSTYIALLVQALWTIGTYWLAWFALRKRERN